MRKLYFAGCVIAAACLGGCTKTNEIELVSKGSGGRTHASCHRSEELQRFPGNCQYSLLLTISPAEYSDEIHPKAC